METTICVAPKITKRSYTRRNSQRTTGKPTTIGEIEPVVHKPALLAEMSQPASTLVMSEFSTEPMLSQPQQLPVVNDTNCVPKKITKRRYTRRNSCRTTENLFSPVNAPKPVVIKPEPVTEMLQSNGTLVALNSPSESVSQLTVANDTNCVPKKITKRRYTRRKTMDIPFPNIDGSTLTTQPTYALVPAKSPQTQPKPPVVNDTNCVPKKITKRRYTRRNSFPMINGPTFTTNSVPVMTHPNYALVQSKSPNENVLPQPKPPAVNETNCVPKKITKRRYIRRNTYRTVENPFVITDITKPVVATPTPVTEMQQSHCTLMVKSPSESRLLQSKATVVNDTNCIPKKITKRRYTRRNTCRTTENPFTKFDVPPPIVLTSSPLIVTPQPELVPPVEINHPPEIEEQQADHENELWYHKKAYSFLKSLKKDYKRFKYLFNYLLREEQEKERRNIQELDELKRIYNRMQVEETEIKRKRWCRYCELEASYLTSAVKLGTMDFNTLLQQAQRLTNETQTSEELPRVERTISQVLEATKELHSRVTQTGAQDIQAHILLGSKGIDLPKISQKLESLNARKTFEPLDPIADTDIQSFLKNEKENAILSVIEEVHKNSFLSAQKRKWEHIKTEWRQEKMKIMNALVGPSQNWIDIQKIPEQTVINETFGARSCLNRIEMAYAREVYEYNAIVIKGAFRPNLVQKFAKVAATFEDPKVNEIWEIMKYMVDVTPVSRNRDPMQSRQQVTQFVEQAKKYLENRYKVYMTTIISGNLREAQRGGVPSIFNLVSSFVGLTFNQGNSFGLQDVTIEGKPLWPMVYYCLRCGDLQSALKCMQMGGAGHEDFIQVLEDKVNKPEQKINSKLEGQLKLHYCNKIKNSTDPYKKAVYCIIAGCDPNEQHLEVAKTTDDFLWIQLSILRTDVTDSSEALTYSGLQTMILEKYGEKHFNAGEQQHLYFQVLALTGQFEAAIEFLSRTEKYRVHAVHIALALNEMFLIAGPRNVQEPLISVDIEDPVPMRRLNIARLVMLYVKKFEITDPAEALQYFFFLRNLKDSDGRNLFLVCVSDLAVECRDYDLLFGKMMPTGMVAGGLFQQFDCVDFDTRTAAAMVAEELVRKGMLEDAIKLYDIANIQSQSLRYLSMLLSQVVHQSSKKGSLRERLSVMAADFMERLRGSRIECDPTIMANFHLLTELVAFFDYYHERKFQIALEVLANTKLVPMSMNDLDECLNNFKRLGGEICKVYPDILLAAMDILYSQYKAVKSKDIGMLDTGRDSHLQHLRQKAKAITNMAATVPYRMPGDTNKRLVQTEILMH